MQERKKGLYAKYVKRVLDIICSAFAFVAFCWLYLILAILVRTKLGSPVLYTATRIGKNGKQFKEHKNITAYKPFTEKEIKVA